MTELPDVSTERATVLYDGQCPLCLRSVAVLRRLDWLGKLDYHNARDVTSPPNSPLALDPSRFLQEMHVLTPDRRRVFAGFRAFRWIAGRLPLLWPVVPLLYLPGVPWLGRRIYLWIARNRFRLAPCHRGQCAVTPRPK